MIANIPTKELAECIGKTQGFASQIKNGWRKLPAKYCVIVSDKFDIPLYELRPDIFPDETRLKIGEGFIERRIIQSP
jgi:DNA-binding transcriptional regulator YdaS (Cro superfamily)